MERHILSISRTNNIFFRLLSSYVNIESHFQIYRCQKQDFAKIKVSLQFYIYFACHFHSRPISVSAAIIYKQSRDNVTRFTRCRFRNNQDGTRGSSQGTLRKS